LKREYFTTGYVYLYSWCLVMIDALTLSRDNSDLLNFEVLSLRVVGLFSYWLLIKNLAGFMEQKGYSYKLAMILGIVGFPALAGLFSLILQ